MQTQELKPAFASSSDPTQVANYIKGLILAASSTIILLAAHVFHITLTPDNIVSLATDVSMVAGAVWFVYGLLHKVVRKVGSIR